MTPIKKVIGDPKAPDRLQGKTVSITVNRETQKLEFACELPDNPTSNELSYLRLRIAEYVEELRKEFPFIGEKQSSEVRQ